MGDEDSDLLVVSPGNLFGGLRLSPFDVDLPGGAGERSLHSLRKTIFRQPSVEKRLPTIQSLFRPPLAHLDRSNTYHDRRKGSTKGCGGEKGGLRFVLKGRALCR